MEVRHHLGEVIVWRPEKGTGVIETENGLKVWANFSAIEMDGHKSLDVGQRVEVEYIDVQQDSYEHRATKIRVIG
ncbi:hypothetical protein GCM10010124_41410 [Pilimelia terevasa]|uniref:CSD domain-containing protein n=1 Tax=Pilimelia terevasa TaxID=53372 RepID=A0A8J3FKB9_9ACTN|nr:cold shock domain-containing protein [Pilimelia terevasa]GGK44289.1 hypothetical protein GCM10010124_41410 [Pilimelia terevasa]